MDPIAVTAALLRNQLPDVPLREGTSMMARVASRGQGVAVIVIAGIPVKAQLPPEIPAGATLKLRVQEVTPERVILQIVTPGQTAKPAAQAPVPQPAQPPPARPGAAPPTPQPPPGAGRPGPPVLPGPTLPTQPPAAPAAPGQAAPGQPAAAQAAPGQPAAAQAAPGQPAAAQAAPGQPAAALPGQAAPAKPPPGQPATPQRPEGQPIPPGPAQRPEGLLALRPPAHLQPPAHAQPAAPPPEAQARPDLPSGPAQRAEAPAQAPQQQTPVPAAPVVGQGQALLPPQAHVQVEEPPTRRRGADGEPADIVTLVFNSPELGRLELRLELRGDHVLAEVTTPAGRPHAVASGGSERLRAKLEAAGLDATVKILPRGEPLDLYA